MLALSFFAFFPPIIAIFVTIWDDSSILLCHFFSSLFYFPLPCLSFIVPCKAGHFSRTGLVPCYPCPRDYYQPDHGRSYCLSCPFYGTTTITGASSIQRCSSESTGPEILAFPNTKDPECVFSNLYLLCLYFTGYLCQVLAQAFLLRRKV